MKINGVEFEFDISDVDDAKNYEDALKHYEERIPELKKRKDGAEAIEYGISMIRDFFYEATGIDILADTTSYIKAISCYKDFLMEVNKQRETLSTLLDDIKTIKPVSTVKAVASPGKPAAYMGGARPPMKQKNEK